MEKITHLEDYLTSEDEPMGFELNSYSQTGDGALHTHAFFEIVYMVNGCAKHEVLQKNGKERLSTLDKGSIILINLEEAHRFLENKTATYLHRDVVIRKSLFKDACDFLSPTLHNDLTSCLIPLQVSVSVDKIIHFEQKIKLIRQILPSKQREKQALIKSLLISLLECFLSSDTEAYFSNFPDWFNEFLANFNKIEYIKAGLPKLIQDCNYDKKYLCFVFKKYTGTTMTEYLNNIRLNYAVSLLRNTNKTVSEIALELGLSSVSYFNVIFKKRYGVTPKEMRRDQTVRYTLD